MAAKNPNCYPQCSDDNLVENLLALNPCIDLTIMKMGMLLENEEGNTTAKQLLNLINIFKKKDKFQTGSGTSLNYGDNLYGFYSLMSATADSENGTYKDIPIFSSPNIQVQHGGGYRNEQSLYTFIQNLYSGSALSKWLGESDMGTIVEGIGTSLAKISEFAGISPRLGPYFSFQDNPFGNTPQLTIEIKLINDSPDAAKNNNGFLNRVVKDTLVSYTGSWAKWIPPQLFNVSLKFGKGGNVVKKYNFCKLSSDIQQVGMIRENNTPDAYNVRLSFTSMIPETKEAWSGGF